VLIVALPCTSDDRLDLRPKRVERGVGETFRQPALELLTGELDRALSPANGGNVHEAPPLGAECKAASSLQSPVSSFQFPVSSFQFPVSSFQSPVSSLQFPV